MVQMCVVSCFGMLQTVLEGCGVPVDANPGGRRRSVALQLIRDLDSTDY